MQNNILDFYSYIDSAAVAMPRKRDRKNRHAEKLVFAAADAFMKLTVSVCMIFCCYLAYTMF